VTTVRSQNDLKPTISTFRSFSKMSPLSLKSRYAGSMPKPITPSILGLGN
jgi:hypothetical protein